MNYGNSTLQRRCSGQGQRRYATVTHLIFEYFAGPSKNRCGACLSDSNLDAGNLSVVQSLEQQQVSAVVHDYDYNRRATLFRFGLRRGRDFLGSVEREHFFHGQLWLRGKGKEQ